LVFNINAEIAESAEKNKAFKLIFSAILCDLSELCVKKNCLNLCPDFPQSHAGSCFDKLSMTMARFVTLSLSKGQSKGVERRDSSARQRKPA